MDSWLAYARFYLCLPVVPREARPMEGPVAGRKGGLPLLPPAMEWPVGPSGSPLPFHGLVDCAALPRDDRLDLRLPVDGYFLFFQDFEETVFNGAEFEQEQAAARLIYVPGDVAVQERPAPAGAFPVVELRALITVDLPEQPEDGPPGGEELRQLAYQVWGGGFGDRDIRLGGYVLVPQDDPLEVVAGIEHEARGGDLEDVRRRVGREWVPLAQLGSEEPVESATVARFLARRSDIAAGDFSHVVSLAEFME